MTNWTLPPNKLNFSTSTVATSALPASNSNLHVVSNGAYDENNNIIFTVVDNNVYNSAGVLQGTLGNLFTGFYGCSLQVDGAGFPIYYSAIQAELGIVPVPGVCNQYYVIANRGMGCLSGVGLVYNILTVNGSTITISNPLLIEASTGLNFGSFAVGKKLANNNRYIYFTRNGNKICRAEISPTGFANYTDVYTWSSGPSEINNSFEMELSHNQNLLAFNQLYSNKVYMLNLANSPATMTIYTAPNGSSVNSIEFARNNTKFFASVRFSTNGNDGIYFVNDLTNTTMLYCGSGSAPYSQSQIELDRYDKMYVVKSTSKELASFPSSTTSTFNETLFSNTFVNSSQNPSGPSLGINKLNDQIDGEDYASGFSGVLSIKLNDIAIGTGTSTLPTQFSPRSIFNCNNIDLYYDVQNANAYQYSIYSSSSNGGKVTFPGSLDFMSGWIAGNPTTLQAINLKSAQGNYLANNTGWYEVKAEAKDLCSTPKVKYYLLNVSGLTAASPSFKFNPGSGTQQVPSNNIASPNLVGGSVGLDLTFSTGTFDSYKVIIDKVNCATGSVTSNVCTTPDVATSGQILSSVGLNYLVSTYCSQSAYFFQAPQLNQCFKITLSLKNACGTSNNVTGFFKVFTQNYRLGALANDETNNMFGFAPNPTNGKANFSFALGNDAPCELTIFNNHGTEVLKMLGKKVYPAGSYTEAVDCSLLPIGFYTYKFSGENLQYGKLIVR